MTLTIWSFMPSDAECARALREVRWAAGLVCLYCGSLRVVKRGWMKKIFQRYKCKDCGRWFNDKTGTAMEYSRLPLRVWFFTAFMMQSKVSVLELTESLEIPYKTMFRLVKKLRENLYLTASTVSLKGVIEMDDVYVTAGLKGKKNLKRPARTRGLKRRGRGTYAEDKPPVLGVVERGGPVRLIPITDVASTTLISSLLSTFRLENVEAAYTDEFPAYNFLASLLNHETVNHSLGEYARGEVHTNTVEGEFSVFRPWIATFRGFSKENTHLYVAQHNFLREHRHMDRVQRTLSTLFPYV